jgi:hypothetical protein
MGAYSTANWAFLHEIPQRINDGSSFVACLEGFRSLNQFGMLNTRRQAAQNSVTSTEKPK